LHDDPETVVAALESGARGYLLKSESPEGIVRAVRDAVQGHCPISLPVTRHLFAAFQRLRAANAVEPLSAREATLFRWVASGSSYKEISTHLGISENTVHTHVRNIHRKLHAANRHEALLQARRLGYLPTREAAVAAPREGSPGHDLYSTHAGMETPPHVAPLG
jgi:DNA-binding NarL/FixJ family response regulator